MPESPDLAVLQEAFQAALTSRPLEGVETPESLVVRATPQELAALRGQQLEAVSRRGKFLVFQLERDRLVFNPMLTGRLGMAAPGARPFTRTAAVLTFGPSSPPPSPRRKRDAAAWTRGADWLPEAGARVELRYRDPTRMGKLYVVPAGAERSIPGWEEQGPDADDPGLDLETWRSRIRRHSGELKGLLRNQTFVAGIGNGYSDEILWAARLAPFRRRSTLAADEIDALYTATREVLAWATAELRTRVPPTFEVEVRDFLRVHRKGGRPCPRCGTRLSEVSPGGFVTTFCRGCQV